MHDESSRSFVAQDDGCDVRFSYGDHEISAKEIGRRINEYEDLFVKLLASKKLTGQLYEKFTRQYMI